MSSFENGTDSHFYLVKKKGYIGMHSRTQEFHYLG